MVKKSEDFIQRYKYMKAEEAVKNLNRRGFCAEFFPALSDAVERVLELVPPGATVGLGGSVTTRESGVVDLLKARGHTLFDHYTASNREESMEIRRKQLTSDVFLTSTNALTLKGELVNLDGTGNRVGSMIFGPRAVIVMAGMNKITEDLDEALRRVKNYASPINYMRINPDPAPPCTTKGYCTDCLPPLKRCRIMTILEGKPNGIDNYHVLIIGEDLGF